jgi:hypothetical protein
MPDAAAQDLLAFRRSPRYRAAIWVGRLANVLVLGYLVWTAAEAIGGGTKAPILLALAGAVGLVATNALLYWAGVQAHFVRSRQETGNAILRDLVAPRP